MSIRIGILGYGNLGKGVEKAVNMNPDQELAAVFTRRDPKTVQIATEGVEVRHTDDLEKMTDEIDVLVICGGSATDLPEMTPKYAALYNVVDSFDTHANIPAHFCHVNQAALSAGKVGIISCGWDPGMFSLSRLYAHSVLPDGHDYTFWGRGVSQGHSDAIRRIDGVKDARQYTVPVDAALQAVRDGLNPQLSAREKHTRECWVVAEDGADTARIEKEIKEMPNYFDEYDTTVHFISAEEFAENHSGMQHGGFVIRSGHTGKDHQHGHVMEFNLKLDSNPEFTSSVLIAYARAVKRLSDANESGCRTVFDIAPALLSPLSPEEMRSHLL